MPAWTGWQPDNHIFNGTGFLDFRLETQHSELLDKIIAHRSLGSRYTGMWFQCNNRQMQHGTFHGEDRSRGSYQCYLMQEQNRARWDSRRHKNQ